MAPVVPCPLPEIKWQLGPLFSSQVTSCMRYIFFHFQCSKVACTANATQRQDPFHPSAHLSSHDFNMKTAFLVSSNVPVKSKRFCSYFASSPSSPSHRSMDFDLDSHLNQFVTSFPLLPCHQYLKWLFRRGTAQQFHRKH